MYPILFQSQHITIYTLWLFVTVGILVSGYYFSKVAVKNKLKLEFIVDKSITLLVTTIISARLFFIFFNFNSYFYEFSFGSFLNIFYIWDKGLYFWPGLLVGILAFAFMCQKEKENFFKWTDIVTVTIFGGLTFFYIGAFFEGIKYGRETSLPIGVTFESATVQYNIPIHPTQIYTAIICLLLAIGLHIVLKKQRGTDNYGFVSLLGAALWSLWYFLEGFLRGDDTVLLGTYRFPQFVSLLFFLASIIFIYLKFFNNKRIKIFSSKE